jgi:ketosteroid isomerase-like protein
MKLTVQLCALALLAGIFSACQAPAPPTLSEADITAIKASESTWVSAANSKDWVALAMLYAEDAIVMPPNHPIVTGRADIQKLFESFPPMSGFQLPIAEIEGRGDLAVVRGTYSLTINQEGAAPVTDTGNWMEMRRKQANGSWLIVRDIWNSDTPMPQQSNKK